MDPLPSNIIFDIFSRIPIKCLARSRCVSKLWHNYINDPYLAILHDQRSVEEEPTLIMFHQNPAIPRLPRTLCFHKIIESDTALKPKKLPYMEFACKKRLSTCSDYVTSVKHRGSCNGLLYISQDDYEVVTNISVIDPIRKHCYELPSLPIDLLADMFKESCGLGFDASANTYKMVSVLPKTNPSEISDFDLVRKNLCTMVHVFGTDSWQEIPQVPPYPVGGDAVFVQGCLYWLVSFQQKTEGSARQVIWFDVTKEEFGMINPPKTTTTDKPTKRRFISTLHDQLVDLNGQVGYVCNRTLEVWVLNPKKYEYEWVLYCRIDEDGLPNQPVKLLGCRNKDGDTVIKVPFYESDRYYVYVLKSGVIQQVDILGRKDNHGTGIVSIYPNSFITINGINTNCNSIRKRLFGLKKSCPRY